ncbi:hypothetical protein AURDEDRAFT_174730 [Auricularia subglabra TFB-10046 SS5]|nr:hypothetical protein AURDEDRAFT_174730 [Auricularia subglabra TFB-10046 SS5]
MACAQSPAIEGLYGVVRSALDSSTGDLCKLGVESANLVVDAASSDVHRAIADFAESWNETNPSLLSSLPNELQISCLEWLSVEALVTASHVSRGWRKLILDAPTLWNEVLPRQRPDNLVALFETAMARSGSVPLVVERVKLYPSSAPSFADEDTSHAAQRLRELLMIAMPKIRSLTVGLRLPDDPIVWRTPAPMLESLHVQLEQHTGRFEWTTIPELWWTTCVPKLRVLRLDSFKLPASFDLENRLELFQGSMCVYNISGQIYETDARLLFLHFPRLVSLDLSDVYDISMLPNTTPPPSLRYVSLGSLHRQRAIGNLSCLLHGWRNLPLRQLVIGRFPQFTIVEAAEYFASKGTGPWELITDPWRPVILQTLCGSDGFKLEVWAAYAGMPGPLTFGASHFTALHSLTLGDYWILAFLLADPDLPALVSLALADNISSLSSAFSRTLIEDNVPPLRAPSLQRVKFAMRAYSDSDEHAVFKMQTFLRARLRYGAPLLQRITLVVGQPAPELDVRAQALCPLASEVVCQYAGREVWVVRPPAVAIAEAVGSGNDLLAGPST